MTDPSEAGSISKEAVEYLQFVSTLCAATGIIGGWSHFPSSLRRKEQFAPVKLSFWLHRMEVISLSCKIPAFDPSSSQTNTKMPTFLVTFCDATAHY